MIRGSLIGMVSASLFAFASIMGVPAFLWGMVLGIAGGALGADWGDRRWSR